MIRKEPHNLRPGHSVSTLDTGHLDTTPIEPRTLEQRIEALERLVGVLSMELRELKDA